MDNPEKLATKRKQTKQKYNIICVAHHNTQANTNNINRTLLQATGGKNEPIIVFMLDCNTIKHHVL